MFTKVKNFIINNKMLAPGDHVVVGVSGGADSVCLLDILCRLSKEYNIKITVVHVNHMIRGEEADSDEAYVKELCEKNNVGFVSVHKDIPQIAIDNKESLELSGRRARYEAFESIKEADKIAVAHHGDDQAETVLFNIFRGSSLKGAGGIRPVRDKIIRPLMCVSRNDIEQYLAERKLEFCTDSTNNQLDYTRNKMRNVIIPYVKENINREVVNSINELAADMQECYDYILEQAKCVYQRCTQRESGLRVCVSELINEPDIIRRQVLMMAVDEITGSLKDITRKHIQSVDGLLFKDVSKMVDLPGGLQVVRRYESLEFKFNEELLAETEYELIKEEDFAFETIDFDGDWQKLTNDYAKVFDCDKIKGTVVLRKRLPGDYFVMDNSGRRKLLKNYFIDKKIPQKVRDSIWLLADGSHILWIVGYRVSEEYKTSQSTKKVLKVTVRRK